MAFHIFSRAVFAVALGSGLFAAAQAGEMKPVPPPEKAVPFDPESVTRHGIVFVPADAMSQQDRLIVANAESSIGEQTARGNIDFAGGGWSYEQIVCPALPNHLFLQYRRAAGTGSETVFSASIPRNGEGRVRIVPIRRRGYSLFSPAPINALTISAFNHIRAEEPEPQRAQGWLGNALCYAALAGGHPQMPDPGAEPTLDKSVTAGAALLRVKVRDGEVIQFADEAATPRPTLWTMTFTQKGKLVKAKRETAPTYGLRSVPAATDVVMKPVPGAPQSVALRPAPAAENAALKPVPTAAQVVLRPAPAGK